MSDSGPASAPSVMDPASIVPPPLRSDLVERPQRYLGRSYMIFKNPLSLGYFRLPIAHVQAARCFDGRTSLRQILDSLRRDSRYWKGMPYQQAVQELIALAGQLGSAGLTRVKAKTAVDRSRRLREAKSGRRFEILMGHSLYFKKSLIDPNRFLERAMPAVEWIFSPVTLTLAGLLMLSAVLVAVQNWAEITSHGANFFTLQNLGLTWLLFIGVKIVHEFGHAFTCKRYGGEVHEMGFMFILFTPYLFCNVSDSWLAQRRHRIAVTAAGIIVELFLASVATWLWLVAQPGLFKQMCFNTMALCSVSTILFNANPLMKFDGYYIMTDLLEIPNLRAKSNAWVTHWAQRTLLGMRSAGQRLASFEVGPLFGVYAVAAYAYGWIITYNIATHMFNMLEPYGLQFVSRTYVGLFLFVSLALPIYRLGKSLKGSKEFSTMGLPRLRFWLLAAGLLVTFLFILPWEESIKRSAALEHGRVEPVNSPAPGYLVSVEVTEGQPVRKGQILGRLENRQLVSELQDLRLQREAALVRQRAANADPTEEGRLTVPVLEKFVAEADEQIRAIEDRIGRLELRSPMDGVLRNRRPDELLGIHFVAGQPVFEVGSDRKPKVVIPLNEKQARKVAAGQRVDVRFAALPGRSFHGRIVSAPVAAGDKISVPGLANLFGGDVPAELDAGGHPVPSIAHFEAEAEIDLSPEDARLFRAHSTGRARIYLKTTTLGEWLAERTLDLIDPQVRL